MNAPIKPFPVAATIATLCLAVLLIGLGVWQVKRLTWKNELLVSLDTVSRADPLLTADDFKTAVVKGQLFLHGHVDGAYLNQDTFLIGPRTSDGQIGYHVYTPLQLQTGDTLLVNRGWIPSDKAADNYMLTGATEVTGLARLPDNPNPFTPANQPDKNRWYFVDFKAVAQAKHITAFLPYVLYVQPTSHAQSTTIYPLPLQMDWRPPNDHLQYALTWFGMAILLFIFYWLRFFPQARNKR